MNNRISQAINKEAGDWRLPVIREFVVGEFSFQARYAPTNKDPDFLYSVSIPEGSWNVRKVVS